MKNRRDHLSPNFVFSEKDNLAITIDLRKVFSITTYNALTGDLRVMHPFKRRIYQPKFYNKWTEITEEADHETSYDL